MSSQRIYILGGYQTDFKRNWNREKSGLYEIMQDTVIGTIDNCNIPESEIESAHIGNFVGELFGNQGQLGGMLISILPDIGGIPVSRHEAACASGSMALVSAISGILSNTYATSLVVGLELMKNVSSKQAADYLSSAAWFDKEGKEAQFMWPYMFSKIYDYYDKNYRINHNYLDRISEINLTNAKENPNAQTRDWTINSDYFSTNDELNPKIEGKIRKSDCGRITDGGAAVVLANEEFAKSYSQKNNININKIPYIKGWGHTTAPLSLKEKLNLTTNSDSYAFPYLRKAIEDAYKKASISVNNIDVFETHDCFSMSEYITIEHFGLTKPGEAWKAIENNSIAKSGKNPINPSGGLIGLGHPVGATGVRMVLDAYKQVTNTAKNYQVDNVNNVACLNFGGSFTTTACFIVGK
ncbi:MAG: acetyl-CoA acetyltransferase [Tenacibaculum sp.]